MEHLWAGEDLHSMSLVSSALALLAGYRVSLFQSYLNKKKTPTDSSNTVAIWLSRWSQSGDEGSRLGYWLSIYALFAVCNALAMALACL